MISRLNSLEKLIIPKRASIAKKHSEQFSEYLKNDLHNDLYYLTDVDIEDYDEMVKVSNVLFGNLLKVDTFTIAPFYITDLTLKIFGHLTTLLMSKNIYELLNITPLINLRIAVNECLSMLAIENDQWRGSDNATNLLLMETLPQVNQLLYDNVADKIVSKALKFSLTNKIWGKRISNKVMSFSFSFVIYYQNVIKNIERLYATEYVQVRCNALYDIVKATQDLINEMEELKKVIK